MANKTYLKTTLAIFIISVLLAQLTFSAPRRYEIIDLGTLGGGYGYAGAVDNAAALAGNSCIIDSVNVKEIQVPNAFWSASELGWLYPPGFSYILTGVLTNLGNSHIDGTSPLVTLEVYDGLPVEGANLLRSAQFHPADRSWVGGHFDPLVLTAGEHYFIGFRNVKDLWANHSYDGVPLPIYYGYDNDGTYPFTENGDVEYAMLKFQGTHIHPLRVPADYPTIQAAIDAAIDGETIIVAEGTYTGEGNRDIDFLGKAITVRSENGPKNCIVDCQESGRGFHFNNGEDQNSILDGFTITNGNVSGRNWRDSFGGGIYCGWQNSPTIRNNRIIANKATIGGGVYCSGETVVRNNLITNNTATFSGGGVHCSRHAVIEQNTITDNVTAGDGGGVECYEWNTVANNVISRNSADRGGGVWTYEDFPATIVDNLISENWAERAGGGIGVSWDYYTIIAGNLIVYNATGGSGGAIYLASDSSLIINNTIVGNTATSGGGIVNLYWEASVNNCIVWGNGDDLFGCTVTYSCIENDDQGEGNIHSNPLFVDPLNSDYHLLADSPCIDAGDPNYIAEPNEADLDGKPRIIGGRIDMGAYEYAPPIPAEVKIVPRTINLASEGKYITCYIWLPEDYNVADIKSNTVFLQSEIQAQSLSLDEQRQVALARFSRSEVQKILNVGEAELTITGRLTDGTVFEGTDVIRVLEKAGKN